jgi:hypothetical protein
MTTELSPNGGSAVASLSRTMAPAPTSALMGQATFTTTLTIGELEASYSLYCKALRILIREGKAIETIKRSVCWHRLTALHHSLPRQYKNPDQLYALIKREINA